ncbi:MAG TPA: phasin family protein [Nevskiaceae bacterium]|nr:phasin family protein [Nevskiaceae bacterium]
MSAKERVEEIRARFERLRRDSVESLAKANRIVFDGVQKFADKELKALNDYYKTALKSLKSAKKSDGIKNVAQQQLELMQETASRVIEHARDSLKVVAEARDELARLVQGGASPKALAKVAEPAQKAIKDVRKAAEKAQKQAIKATQDVRKAVDKTLKAEARKASEGARTQVAAVKKAVGGVQAKAQAKAEEVRKQVKQTVGSVLDLKAAPPVTAKPVMAKPSPTSRASRATSKAKRASDSTMPPKAAAAPKPAASKPKPRSTMPPKKTASGDSTMPPKKPQG